MLRGDRSGVEEEARQLLESAGENLAGPSFDRLCWELQRTKLRLIRECADEWEADFPAGLGGSMTPEELLLERLAP